MTPPDGYESAVAAGVLASEEQFGRLLRSIVEVARAIFGAQGIVGLPLRRGDRRARLRRGRRRRRAAPRRQAAAVVDRHRRLGSLLATPLVLDDVQQDPRFAREVAEGTGYVPEGPDGGAAARRRGRARRAPGPRPPAKSRFSLQEMELLGLFAGQAAIALALLGSARRARRALEGEGDAAAVAALASALESLEGERRAAAAGLLRELTRILEPPDRSTKEGPRRGPSPVFPCAERNELFGCRVAVAAELVAVAAELIAVAARVITVAAELVCLDVVVARRSPTLRYPTCRESASRATAASAG